MADYSVEFNDTASTTLGAGQVDADARKIEILEWIFGSEATAADNPFLWKLSRVTAAGSLAGTTITPAPFDSTEAAALFDALENLTTNPGVGAALLTIPLNQRATFRWVAQPGVPLISPATAANGFICLTPTSSAVAISEMLVIREH